jgi:hypothetical protein
MSCAPANRVPPDAEGHPRTAGPDPARVLLPFLACAGYSGATWRSPGRQLWGSRTHSQSEGRAAPLGRRTNPLAREGSTRRGRRIFDEVMRGSA